jgi:hypothetical protein
MALSELASVKYAADDGFLAGFGLFDGYLVFSGFWRMGGGADLFK